MKSFRPWRIITLITLSVMCLCVYNACKDKAENTTADGKLSPYGVPLPNPGIAGFSFPEAEPTINNWLSKGDSASIYLHGWGIWTALTSPSGLKAEDRELLVFETWLTPNQMLARMGEPQVTATKDSIRPRSLLQDPHQFKTSPLQRAKLNRFKTLTATQGPTSQDTFGIKVSVNYSPDAAEFTVKNKLFYKSVLDSMVKAGNTKIPDFPSTAITLKPVYKRIRPQALINGKYYVLPVWPGTPPGDTIAFDEPSWNTYVYVDVTNSSAGTGHVIKPGEQPDSGNAYNIRDFIHYKIDAGNKAALNASDNEYIILVAMHVTSREITRWTWQTFWWDPTPKTAEAPTSQRVIDAKPAQLKGPAHHYAMAIAYTFIEPDQPLTGGNNTGTSLYAFNPYLEAGFDPAVFQYGGTATVITNGATVVNNVGMRTNCMSCHALATFNINDYSFGGGNTVPYIGNTYIDMDKDSIRKKYLTLDFAWSIQGSIDPNK